MRSPRFALLSMLVAVSVVALLGLSPSSASEQTFELKETITFTSTRDNEGVGGDAVHTDPGAFTVDLLESSSSQPNEKFEPRSAIVFASTRDYNEVLADVGKIEIYLMLTKQDGTPDPTETRRLTTTTAGETYAVLSPDGKKIVFDSNRDRAAVEPENTSDLFLMNTDGTEQIKLTRGSSASWSPDSKKIAFHASKSGTEDDPINDDPGAPYFDSDIFVMNVDDCIQNLDACRAKQAQPGVLPDFLKNVTNDGATAIDEDADWSPDGQKLAFTRRVSEAPLTAAEIYVIHPDGTGLIQLTNNTEEERAPDWSPNGLRIAYVCRTGDLAPGQTVLDFETCVMNADGTGVQRLTNNTVPDTGHSWSPTGDQMVFSKPAPGTGLQVLRRELFVRTMNPDGTCVKGLDDQCVETQLTFRPGLNIDSNWGVIRVKAQ